MFPRCICVQGKAMKKTTDQIEFERLVSICHQQHQNDLKLANPRFGCYNSAISNAIMSGSGGFVEILYGPPDFHVELFITSSKEKRRWELRDLMTIETVREWLVNLQPATNSSREIQS